jgi:hypothetical protein
MKCPSGRPDEFRTLASEELPAGTEVLPTFKLPILTLVTTPAPPLADDALRERLRAMRRALRRRYGRQLDDIRLFFRLGGLKHDPFS